jgi:hypothetical protein
MYCKDSLPRAFREYFQLNLAIHEHETRSAKDIHLKTLNSRHGARALHYRAASLWNTLPKNLKCAASLNIFISQLKKHYVTVCTQ